MLIRLPSLSEPRWHPDDGLFTVVAWATSKGIPLYAGIFDNSPPGIYWLYRLLLLLGADRYHVVVQLAATLAVAAAALLTFEITRQVAQPWPAVLAGALTGFALSVPTLDGDLLNVELAALPLFLAALRLAFTGRLPGAFLAGALLGLTVATRPSFAFDGLALLVPLSLDRRLAAAAAGGLTALVAVLGMLWMEGSLAAFVQLVLPAERAYLLWANGGSLAPVLARLGTFAVVAGLGLGAARTPAGRLLAIWLPASLAGASLAPRELTHYAHEAIPALAFGLALLAARFRWRWAVIPAAAASLLLAAQLTVVLPAWQTAGRSAWAPNFSYAQAPAFYGNWFAYMTGGKSWQSYSEWFPGVAGRRPLEAELLRSQLQTDGSRLLILGDQPWLYLDTGLLPATPYPSTNSAFWRSRGAAGETRQALRKGCAQLVVYSDGPGDWLPDLEAGGYQPVEGAPWATFQAKERGPAC